MYDEYYDEDEWAERVERFADPGGPSALHVADSGNPRNLPCPTCGWPNRLTPRDVAAGYQCDSCADALERGQDIYYYDEDEEEDELWLDDGI